MRNYILLFQESLALFRKENDMKVTVSILFLFVSISLAWDPLAYGYLGEVLSVTETESDFSFGYFSSSQYWETDTLGFDSLYDFRDNLGVIRFQWAGRYGLTPSHTISLVVPGFLQIAGSNDTLGVGIADPWICFDGWISRNPQFVLRGALRPTLKGTLDTGNYTESDRHVAAEISGTATVPINSSSSGPRVQFTGGLRHYFTAWDQIPSSPGDSADTSPPTELRGEALLILPVNRELNFHAGLEFATRGETEVNSVDINGSEMSYVDLRSGIQIDNSQLSFEVDVYYRMAGQNVNKEWGIVVSGIGFDMGDVFDIGSSGRSGTTDSGRTAGEASGSTGSSSGSGERV